MKKLIIILAAVLGCMSVKAQVFVSDTIVKDQRVVFKSDSIIRVFLEDAANPKVGVISFGFSYENLLEGDTLRYEINGDTVVAENDQVTFSSSDDPYALDTLHSFSLLYTTGSTNRHYASTAPREFIPDGVWGGSCTPNVQMPIVVSGYPSDATITSADQIASICINIEHSFGQETVIDVVCPNGNSASLKGYREGNGGAFLGIPQGGAYHHSYDDLNGCDSSNNPAGTGWNYCFSQNSNYTLYNGNPADAPGVTTSAFYNPNTTTIGTSHDQMIVFDSSDYNNRTGYYWPKGSLDSLIGCPANGTWIIRVVDNWAEDNGWVFGWNIDFDLGRPGDDSSHTVVNNLNIIIIYEDTTTTPVGIDGTPQVRYSVYPNPSGSMINVEGGDFDEVVIFDITGREVFRSSETKLDVSALSRGTYVLRVLSREGGAYTLKMVKQ